MTKTSTEKDVRDAKRILHLTKKTREETWPMRVGSIQARAQAIIDRHPPLDPSVPSFDLLGPKGDFLRWFPPGVQIPPSGFSWSAALPGAPRAQQIKWVDAYAAFGYNTMLIDLVAVRKGPYWGSLPSRWEYNFIDKPEKMLPIMDILLERGIQPVPTLLGGAMWDLSREHFLKDKLQRQKAAWGSRVNLAVLAFEIDEVIDPNKRYTSFLGNSFGDVLISKYLHMAEDILECVVADHRTQGEMDDKGHTLMYQFPDLAHNKRYRIGGDKAAEFNDYDGPGDDDEALELLSEDLRRTIKRANAGGGVVIPGEWFQSLEPLPGGRFYTESRARQFGRKFSQISNEMQGHEGALCGWSA